MFGADRVLETSLTQGTGNFTLLGAAGTYQSFASGLPSGQVIEYTIVCPVTGEWEVGLGSVTSETLTRALPLSGSSGVNTLVSFGAGVKQVFVTVCAATMEGASRMKPPCLAVTTANVTISTALVTGQVVNGVTLTAGMRVLVPFQSTASQNGMYLAGATPSRAPDLWTGMSAGGMIVAVATGPTLYPGTLWECTSPTGSDVVDTNNLAFARSLVSSDLTPYAPLASPALTGVPTVPTAAPGTNTTQAASTAFVEAAVSGGGTGNVTTGGATTVDNVPAWDTTSKDLRPSSAVSILYSENDRLLIAALAQTYAIATDALIVTFDLSVANLYQLTMGGDRTLAVSNVRVGSILVVNLLQDATGGRNPTWFANITWANAEAPTIDTTASTGWNLVALECVGSVSGIAVWQELFRRGSNIIGSLFAAVTTQGNTFNGVSQLVQLDGSGKLPAIDGSQLTNLPTSSSSNGLAHRGPIQSRNANYTIQDTDDVLTSTASLTGNVTFTLSNGVSYSSRKAVTVINLSSVHNVSLVTTSGEYFAIRGATSTSIVLAPGDVVQVAYITGGDWAVSYLVRAPGTGTTGSGTALLGANCPAATLTAPYAWIPVIAWDGSTVYMPAWK